MTCFGISRSHDLFFCHSPENECTFDHFCKIPGLWFASKLWSIQELYNLLSSLTAPQQNNCNLLIVERFLTNNHVLENFLGQLPGCPPLAAGLVLVKIERWYSYLSTSTEAPTFKWVNFNLNTGWDRIRSKQFPAPPSDTNRQNNRDSKGKETYRGLASPQSATISASTNNGAQPAAVNEICGRPHVIQNIRLGGRAGVYWSKTNARQENQSTRCVTIWTVMSQRII